jgi:eukaryotic-like serine/threonine-protein kinase
MEVRPATDAQRLRDINRLLEAALALPASARAAWLKTLPPQQQPLVPVLAALLARADADSDTFMRQPLALTDGDLLGAELRLDQSGDTVGPWQLVRELGAGGMATVWLAERVDGGLRRPVALKLPRVGWTPGLAQRMQRERDILAGLEHPHIARLYDAGTTDAGRPWLAMEQVVGEAIDVHCQAAGLDVKQRLHLFLQVAEAVSHAHARLVVHRDLKPSNILVTPQGDVRLLDFGIAKLLADEEQPSAALTQVLGCAVTPDYASPEQLGGQPLTVATDVYSLGVVLYELLTGARPYQLGTQRLANLQQAIQTADVPLASSRAADRPRLARQLRGDLDNVLAKALRKDAARRYPSVESMATDIRRHLAGEPVMAQPRSRWYRAGKFVSRHRLPLATAAAVLLTSAAGTSAAMWQAHVADLQRQRALDLLRRAESAVAFANDVVTQGIAADERLSLDALMARSAELAARPTATPMDRAVATDAVSGWLMSLSRHAQAEPLLRSTLLALPADFDAPLRQTLQCKLGFVVAAQGHKAEGERLMDDAIAASAADPATAANCLVKRARVARDHNESAAALGWMQQAMQRFSRAAHVDPREQAMAQAELAYALSGTGRATAAGAAFTAAVQQLEAIGHADSVEAVTVFNNWGIALLSAGNPQAASAQLDRAVEVAQRRAPGGDLPGYLLYNRATASRNLALVDRARQDYQQLLEQSGKDGNATFQVAALNGLASLRAKADDAAGAQQLLDEAAALLASGRVPAGSPAAFGQRFMQSLVWQRGGRIDDALGLVNGSLADFERTGTKIGSTAALLMLRSELNLALQQVDQALSDALQARDVAQQTQGEAPLSYLTGQAWLALAKAQHAKGLGAEARASVEQARVHLVATVGAAHPHLQEAQQLAQQWR